MAEDVEVTFKNTSFNQHEKNNLIIWKIIRAFSGVKESKAFLKEYYLQSENSLLKLEIERSLRLIRKLY